jgi:GT2 family glycosyltransferase|tara:strand:- start:27283 stop:28026 length:744 start_codon:yes stop_codon:yes gene_type:complete
MVKIITPYVSEQEITEHKQLFWEYDIYYERDDAGIGSDLMFQKMWNKFPNEDIFILHADMTPHHDNWFEEVLEYVEKYPEAGMFGCLLLYPAKDVQDNFLIQSAGGKFTNGTPDHYGSGLIIENKTLFKQELESDTGQYNSVREVAWTTFGGCYIRRTFIDTVGNFSPEYEWTYNRDVDYCLTAREKGKKIYQLPVRLMHHESRDNKRIKQIDNSKVAMESRNLARLQTKWANSKFYKTLDTEINSG